MSTPDRFQRLAALAEMKRERDMARLSRLGSACEATRAKLRDLTETSFAVDDPALFAVQQAHRAWAEAQRMQLNQKLALQTAHLLEARMKTAHSFGRVQALEKLAALQRQRKTHSP